jgi:hypothetical protein
MTADPFARHGIDHISPSSLRLFKENLAVWIGRYLLRVSDEAGPKAWRGQAVEAGLDQMLFSSANYEDALAQARREWDRRAMGLASDDAIKEYELLGDFLKQAMQAFDGKGMPLTRQGKIEIDLPGIEVKLQGYTDYRYAGQGYDLKTTHRIPSKADPIHVEQMSAYMLSSGMPFTLVYVSTKRWSAFDVTPQMAAAGYDRLLEGAQAMRAFLAKVEDARDALSMVAPDYENFYFTPPMIEAVKAAKRPIEPRPSGVLLQ